MLCSIGMMWSLLAVDDIEGPTGAGAGGGGTGASADGARTLALRDPRNVIEGSSGFQ